MRPSQIFGMFRIMPLRMGENTHDPSRRGHRTRRCRGEVSGCGCSSSRGCIGPVAALRTARLASPQIIAAGDAAIRFEPPAQENALPPGSQEDDRPHQRESRDEPERNDHGASRYRAAQSAAPIFSPTELRNGRCEAQNRTESRKKSEDRGVFCRRIRDSEAIAPSAEYPSGSRA